MSNIVGYSGKDFLKEIMKNEIKDNQDNKESQLNRSCKKVTVFFKAQNKRYKIKER